VPRSSCRTTAWAKRRRRSSTIFGQGRYACSRTSVSTEEEKDDELFAQKLAELAEVYVDDAFGAVHRAHASVHALPKLMREKGCGFLLEKEIAALGKLVAGPDAPYIAVLGGAKVSDKIAVVNALLQKVNALVIGGAMANTFLAAQGRQRAGVAGRERQAPARALDPRKGERPRAST
jgi:3-phosphoglycerate kinase